MSDIPKGGPANGGPYFNKINNFSVPTDTEGDPNSTQTRLAEQQAAAKSTYPESLSYAYAPIDSRYKVLQDTSFLKDSTGAYTSESKSSQGVKAAVSLHSMYQVFAYQINTDPDKFRETNSSSIGKLHIEPTFQNLIEKWQDTPTKQPYYWNDFIYAKWYEMIPNNAMITLRRYPFPIIDNPANIKDKNNPDSLFPPIAQAVTWFGTETGNSLKDIMNMSAEVAWREIISKINTVDGNEKGGQSSLLGFLTGEKNRNDKGRSQDYIDAAKQDADHAEPFSNKLYGKLNVVKDVQVRDRGLMFKQEFELKFTYNLKLYDHINPKIAMLDLIANILSLCYNNGTFWGGTNRYFPNVDNPGFFGDQGALYSGQYSKYFDSVKAEFNTITSGAGNFFKSLVDDPIGALKQLAGEAATFALGNILADSRPKMVGFPALMTGAPTGDWHLVIGNPFNPILTVGNLICKGVKFEFSEQLAHDDFPDEVTCIIKLDHARSRDKGDIESMFNVGKGRLYYSLLEDPNPPANKGNISGNGTRFFNDNKTQQVPEKIFKTSGQMYAQGQKFWSAVTNI